MGSTLVDRDTASGQPRQIETAPRRRGSVVAVGIALVVWAVGAGLALASGAPGRAGFSIDAIAGDPFTPAWLMALGAFGAPVVAALGWLLGPSAVCASGRGALWPIAAMAGGAVSLGSYLIVTVSFVLATVHQPSSVGPGELAALGVGALVYPLIGILLVGPVVLVVTAPASIAWFLILRRVSRPTAPAG